MKFKHVFYVAENTKDAIAFIKANTKWKQVTAISFRNGDENIVVISDFWRIRGRKVDGVYIDHSFSKMKDNIYMDFIERFRCLGVEPIMVNERPNA